MIRRLLFRGPAPRADRDETEAEAQRAYREALDQARCERIAELEQRLATAESEVIRLRAKLRVAEHVAGAQEWMRAPARAARIAASLIREPEKGRHR